MFAVSLLSMVIAFKIKCLNAMDHSICIYCTAPKIFAIIFNLMKGFLHPLTVEKVRIFSTNKDEWQAAILEEIEADQIPEMYGGTLKNPKDGDQAGLFKVYIS